MENMIEATVNAERVEDLIAVFGSFDENIRRIEEALDISIVKAAVNIAMPTVYAY